MPRAPEPMYSLEFVAEMQRQYCIIGAGIAIMVGIEIIGVIVVLIGLVTGILVAR